MKDLTFNKKDKKDFILGYKIKDNEIIVKYADTITSVLPYSIENIRKIEKKMVSQALDIRYTDNIDNKLRINNLVINTSAISTVVSIFALGGFAIAKKENIGGAFFIATTISAVVNSNFTKRREKLLRLREEAEKYKLIAENLSKFNNAFNEKSDTREFTMNDADSFDLQSFQKLLSNIK